MRTEHVHTLILGAGPAGLAAGYTLAQSGHKPVLLERDKVPGGLMRSIHRGDFVVDVGRKELYNRLERVDAFWSRLLGDDYRTYDHRGGFLYDGHILEMTPAFRGLRRGMPWSMMMGCAADLFWSRLKPGQPKPRNVEEYFYQSRGRTLTRIAAQGFQEKLTGVKWAEVPLPDQILNNGQPGLMATLRAAFSRMFSTKEVNTFKGIWKHPARGTGQICDLMAHGMTEAGGTLHCGSSILGMQSSNGRVESVTAQIGPEQVRFECDHVISSVPLEILLQLLGRPVPETPPRPGVASLKRTVILVYLFLNRPPTFPHAWLQVTCPSTRIGRITNYAAYSEDMVPPGKGCLCCEYYCYGDDPLLALDDEALQQLTVADCAKSGLLDPSSCFDRLVLRLPGADASRIATTG